MRILLMFLHCPSGRGVNKTCARLARSAPGRADTLIVWADRLPLSVTNRHRRRTLLSLASSDLVSSLPPSIISLHPSLVAVARGEKKLSKVIVPDKWKDGASNTTEGGGRKINENKLLTKKSSTKGQVHKVVEIDGLEIYCNSSNGASSLTIRDNAGDDQCLGNANCESNQFHPMLAPLNVSVSLSATLYRRGKEIGSPTLLD
ncbi:hypothetical protein NL676_003163 [Syzygium grande]|nr:hypothetical protein NL676_003163 [Syzygium grande]